MELLLLMVVFAYGMNKYEYLDRIVFSNEYMNNIILEYKDIKSITVVGKITLNMKAIIRYSKLLYVESPNH